MVSNSNSVRTRTERVPILTLLRALRDDSLGAFSETAFDEDLIEQRLLWRRTFIVNEPAAIKQVLVDNAGNYQKSELARRLLEPGLGRGLLTSEGDTWRRHRRIMAPAFEPRTVATYAPLMVHEIRTLLVRWDGLPNLAEIDVATEMMHLTLRIISRCMFSLIRTRLSKPWTEGSPNTKTRCVQDWETYFGFRSGS
jgi:cytochrome P450